MKTFKLISNIGYDVTRSVKDMAALFTYTLCNESENVLQLKLMNSQISAQFICGDKIYQSMQYCISDTVSGEYLRYVKLAVIDVLQQAETYRVELPWGILTGVRPDKLAHKLFDTGITAEQLAGILQQKYLLPREKAVLLTEICLCQDSVLPDRKAAGIYIGIPFCPTKCTYCSFPSAIIPQDEECQQNFLNFIEQDIRNVVKLISMHRLNIKSLYIGGGTPTSLSEKAFARLLDMVQKYLGSYPWQEFTVEAGRPDCFSVNKLAAMEYAGVSRISVNPQTLHDKTLRLIGRSHSVDDFYRAYAMAAKSSIPVINTDLIIGLPGETEADIFYSFDKIRELNPHNLTVHTLTLKKSAALFGSAYSLEVDQAAKMVGCGMETAAAMGMHPYYLYRQHYMLGNLANIGYALPGTESIYNIQMMEERHPVIGIGPSSATKVPLRDGHHLNKLNMPKNLYTYTENLQRLMTKRQQLFEEEEV